MVCGNEYLGSNPGLHYCKGSHNYHARGVISAKIHVVFEGRNSPLKLGKKLVTTLLPRLCGAGERNRGYALLMMANKPETALYTAPTFFILLASHGGISSCTYQY